MLLLGCGGAGAVGALSAHQSVGLKVWGRVQDAVRTTTAGPLPWDAGQASPHFPMTLAHRPQADGLSVQAPGRRHGVAKLAPAQASCLALEKSLFLVPGAEVHGLHLHGCLHL